MKVKRFILGDEKSNCYIISKNGKALIVDMGAYHQKISKYLLSENLQVVAILCTHGHYDHVDGIQSYIEKNPIKVYFNEADAFMLKKRFAYTSIGKGTLKIDDFIVECMEMPGHSMGGMVYKIENLIFSGDLVFKDGIGRYDLDGSNRHDLKQSLNKLAMLDVNYMLYPGHEDSGLLSDFLTSIQKNQ